MDRESSYWQRYRGRRLSRRGVLRGAALGAAGLTAAALLGCEEEEGPPAATTPAAGTPAPGTPAAETRAYWGAYPPPPKYSTLAVQNLLAEFHFSKMGPKFHVLGTPRMGGVFGPQTYNPPQTLHPLDPVVTTTGQWPQGPAVSNLVMPDWWDDPERNPSTTRYALSQSFETPDPQTFIFKLRTPRPWFHDIAPANGAEVTIDDIRTTYDLYKGHRFFALNFKDIASITEPEPGVVRITTSEPAVQLLGALRKEAFTVLNAKAIAEGDAALNNKMIGLGPFMQGKFTPNVIRLFKRNPRWWWPRDQFGNQQPYMDGFVMRPIGDAAAGLAAFRTGQTDYYRPVTLEEFERLRNELGEQVWPFVAVGPASSINYITPSHRTPAFKDVRVRRALAMAIDKQSILDNILGGGGTPRPWIPWYFRGLRWPETLDEMGSYQKFDPEGARNLLREAGVALPLKLELHFLGRIESVGGGAGALALGDPYTEPARTMLRNIGIEVELKPYGSSADFNRLLFDGQWTGLASSSIGTSAIDADEWVQRAVSTSGTNSLGINDPEIDRLFLKERATVDVKEREKVFQEIEKRAVQDQVLWGAALPRAFSMFLMKKYVHNIIESSLYTINGGLQMQLAETWLDDKAPSRNIDSF